MPYRRLPKTDKARIKTLENITKLERRFPLNQIPVQLRLITEAAALLGTFTNAVQIYNQTYENMVTENKKLQQITQNARMYISHFIQVLNMSVQRGEIKREYKEMYKLHLDDNTLPDLTSDDALLEWGANLINGENARMQHGGVPMQNPSIARLQVHFDIFKEYKNSQKIRQISLTRTQNIVIEMRPKVDALIKLCWDDIETYYRLQPPYTRLQSCTSCGIIYYYRHDERPLTPADDKRAADLFSTANVDVQVKQINSDLIKPERLQEED